MNHSSSSTTPICYTRLIGHINENTIKDVLKDIDGANSNENKKFIIFTLCSNGGALYYAQALYDAIKASIKPVICIASGQCMSAGLMILQAAHKRIARTNTIFMLHQASYWREEQTYIDEINIMSGEWNRLYKQFVTQSIHRSTITHAEFEKIAKPRKYFTAKEALDIKLIDSINDEWVDS